MNKKMTVREELEALAEPEYKIFAEKLIPGCDNMLGVRIPKIRKMAGRIAREEGIAFLQEEYGESFEETLLRGLVIGSLKEDIDTILSQTEIFIPHISNWSLCDSFCSGFQAAKKHREEVWDFLQPYSRSKNTYDVRMAVVMMLDYYINEEYLNKIFHTLDSVLHEDYYVKMAVAWAVSICFVRFPKETDAYLKENKLDLFTYNKALQKICESKRVSDREKIRIRKMKKKRLQNNNKEKTR